MTSTSTTGDLLPALFAVNIPAVVAWSAYILSSRRRRSTLEAPLFAEYERKTKQIRLVETGEQWESFWAEVEEEVSRTKVVGFDCEWISASARRRRRSSREEGEVEEEEEAIDGRVSMMQIATVAGRCGLVRLLKMDVVPDSLKALLANRTVLKLGVSPKDDGSRLRKDHGIEVSGCLDLRALALRCRDFEHLDKLGLKHLTEAVLGKTLDKSPQVRLSNWEVEELTDAQKTYAANDAMVATDIFKEIVVRKSRRLGLSSWFSRSSPENGADFWTRAFSMCQGLVDDTFKAPSPRGYSAVVGGSDSSSHKRPLDSTAKFNPRKTKAYVQRAKPLYENCHLMAPDGELLSTCNANKAMWYVEKELGDIVSKEGEQLKVRLRFEPAGRPVEDGIYYIQEKENRCVVCGSENDFNLRKNIIPQEYRKHFPTFMKDHSSHDVLLMCLPCHQLANLKDHLMRLRLAEMCDAPIGTMMNIRCFEDADLKKVKSFGKALLQNKSCIPEDRQREMKKYLSEYYEVPAEELGDEIYQRAAKMDTKTPNDNFKPHGLKVIEWMNVKYGDDLAELEKMWRQHFVDEMKPQFLPYMWSVDHNHKNVRARVAQGDTKFLKHRLSVSARETGSSSA